MRELTLMKPSTTYFKQIWEYRSEFLAQGDALHGCSGLDKVKTVDEWLANLEKNSCEETVTEGLVPATTYLAIGKTDHRLVGMINIRHRLNDFLFKSGGHIGYSVRPTERRKGYATEMVRLALKECCEALALSRVLITCD